MLAPGRYARADASPRPPPDLRHVECWIFDLDNTLYSAHCGVFDQIDARMTLFVARHFGLDLREAVHLQKALYRDHGTTLNGLMREHGVDADAYLAYVHDVALDALAPSHALAAGLERLPGRRFVFTNGCRRHAERVLARLAIESAFEDIWDIRTTDFVPKPAAQAFETVTARSGIAPRRAAMFEDMARNLVPAHGLGMTTVWLRNDSPWSRQGPDHPVPEPAHIHYETDDLARFLGEIAVANPA